MRIRRSRLENFYWRSRISKKDKEGSSYEEWGQAISFQGECWPASGRIQAQQYGERLPYIRNIRIEGKYVMCTDKKGHVTYDFGKGLQIRESDGICLYVEKDMDPDYKILSIKPYRPLRMEVERRI